MSQSHIKMSSMELWKEAKEHYAQAMQAKDTGKSLELYDKCLEALLKAAEYEETGKNRLLLFLNTQQVEANKRTVLANMLKDKACREALPDKAAKYFRKAANYHLASVKFREEAASIAKETGDNASYYNLLGCAYHDQAFYHSYLALEAQKTGDLAKVPEEYKNALKFLEAALKHYNLSVSTSINEETENNRLQCLKYLENFRTDLREVEKDKNESMLP